MRSRLDDSKLLARIKNEVAQNIERRGGAGSLVISQFQEKPSWEGKSLEIISKIIKKSPVETTIELALMGNARVVSFCMSDADVEYFMKKPYVMTITDGFIPTFGQGVPHPRSYGAFPRKIRHYVFEKGIISMTQFIRSCTSLPAEMLGLRDRGLLKKGFAADIVVFNPKTIRDKATFTNPHQYSEGIEYLYVNGVAAIEKGKYNGCLAGKVLRL
jgi:N-acyl-D-amino-acid deacylase